MEVEQAQKIGKRTEKNRDMHLKFYNYAETERAKYNRRLYDRRLSKGDRKKIESKFAFRKKPFTIKHTLIFIIIFVTALLLVGLNTNYLDKNVLKCFILLFFLLGIALGYDVNSKFYWMFLILFLLVIFFASYTNFTYGLDDELKEKIRIAGNNKKMNNKKMNNNK